MEEKQMKRMLALVLALVMGWEDAMPRYNKSNTQELKDFLYNSYVHDAKLENIKIHGLLKLF